MRTKTSKNLAWREISGQVFIVDPDNSYLHELNETGSFIWKLMERAFSPEEIAKRLSKEFDVVPAEAADDVKDFIETLINKKIAFKERR